jgi:hypothetical protein
MKLGEKEARALANKAQLRCVRCCYFSGVEVVEKMHLVRCLTAPTAEGHLCGFVNFVQARTCASSRKESFEQLSAHNTPPPDS